MVGKFKLGGWEKTWKIRVFVVLGAQLLGKISDKVISVYELERSRDMFKSSQIVSTTIILKEFRNIARYLEEHPQALLITQHKREPLVLVNAAIFEELLQHRLAKDGVVVDQPGLRDVGFMAKYSASNYI